MKEFLIALLIALLGILLIAFLLYGFIGFLDFMFSDPLDLIKHKANNPQSKLWDRCIEDTKNLFDDFTDTWGASYALEDLPSQGVQDFMKFCLESSKKEIK